MLLVMSMTGLAAAATLVDETIPATLLTFEDLNGNGIDDDCETTVTAQRPPSPRRWPRSTPTPTGCLDHRSGPEWLGRWHELQPRRLRQPGRHGSAEKSEKKASERAPSQGAGQEVRLRRIEDVDHGDRLVDDRGSPRSGRRRRRSARSGSSRLRAPPAAGKSVAGPR